MKIVRATPADAARLTHIALASKRHWNYPERWIALWTPQLTLTPDYIATREVYAALDGNEIIGFYTLTPTSEGERLVLDHLWLLPKAIGQGVGRALFAHAVERARTMGARQLEIEAEPNAVGFYERMGARIIGEHMTEIEGTPRRLPVLLLDL
jgi:GNAT superfamily N-acetyltransferase